MNIKKRITDIVFLLVVIFDIIGVLLIAWFGYSIFSPHVHNIGLVDCCWERDPFMANMIITFANDSTINFETWDVRIAYNTSYNYNISKAGIYFNYPVGNTTFKAWSLQLISYYYNITTKIYTNTDSDITYYFDTYSNGYYTDYYLAIIFEAKI